MLTKGISFFRRPTYLLSRRFFHKKPQLSLPFYSKLLPTSQYTFTSDPKPPPSQAEDYMIQEDPTDEIILNPEITPPKPLLKEIYLPDTLSFDSLQLILEAEKDDLLESFKHFSIQPQKPVSLDQAELVGYEYGYKFLYEKSVPLPLEKRDPIVTIMGHVDHGKTTLLDKIRNSNIVDTEFGQITQKIGAFHHYTSDGQRITYIDTPGHEAFNNLRKRGATCTDIIILVVSAVEGIKPQTIEVLNLVKDQRIPLIVAINKIDLPNAEPDLVSNELFDQQNLGLEMYGGNIPSIEISAKTGLNIDLLQELIIYEAEKLQLKEKRDTSAEGIVLESKKDKMLDSKYCSIIVQKGTLKMGDWIVVGDDYFRVKQMKDDKNQLLEKAFPSNAVEITGMKALPNSGDLFFVVEQESKADLIATRIQKLKQREINESEKIIDGTFSKLKFARYKERRSFYSGDKAKQQEHYNNTITSLEEQLKALPPEDLAGQEEITKKINQLKEYLSHFVDNLRTDKQTVKILLKAQDFGTLETLRHQIEIIQKQSSTEIKLSVIDATIGQITENDIRNASLSNARILCMDSELTEDAEKMANQEKITVTNHKIIYTLLDEIKDLLAGPKDKTELTFQGSGKILDVIKIKEKIGVKKIAGVSCKKGRFTKQFLYRIIREGQVIKEGLQLTSLKHFKKEVAEIKKDQECGIMFFEFSDINLGDTIEAYTKD